jgi:hypothetical protein
MQMPQPDTSLIRSRRSSCSSRRILRHLRSQISHLTTPQQRENIGDKMMNHNLLIRKHAKLYSCSSNMCFDHSPEDSSHSTTSRFSNSFATATHSFLFQGHGGSRDRNHRNISRLLDSAAIKHDFSVRYSHPCSWSQRMISKSPPSIAKYHVSSAITHGKLSEDNHFKTGRCPHLAAK